MAVTVLLDELSRGARLYNEVDVVLQPGPPQYGLGRIHTKAATGHGCVTFLLLRPLQKGRITDTLAGLELLNLDEKLSDSHTRALTVPPTFRHNL